MALLHNYSSENAPCKDGKLSQLWRQEGRSNVQIAAEPNDYFFRGTCGKPSLKVDVYFLHRRPDRLFIPKFLRRQLMHMARILDLLTWPIFCSIVMSGRRRTLKCHKMRFLQCSVCGRPTVNDRHERTFRSRLFRGLKEKSEQTKQGILNKQMNLPVCNYQSDKLAKVFSKKSRLCSVMSR